MGVNFYSVDEDTMACEECGKEVDSDHYNDMVAHDAEHAAERARVEALPRTVVVYDSSLYAVARKDQDGVYHIEATATSQSTAEKIAAAL